MSLKQLEDSVSIGAHSVSDFLGKTSLKVKANEMKQLLTKKQELVLINHISRLYKWCLPPTLAIVTT
jgi:hypothetical protein